MTAQVSLLRIYVDLATAWALLAIAPAARALLSAEDHRLLADRYGRLARRWRKAGWTARADANDEKAAQHAREASLDDPPPAVAVGLPRPRPCTRVEARGRLLAGRWTPRSTTHSFTTTR